MTRLHKVVLTILRASKETEMVVLCIRSGRCTSTISEVCVRSSGPKLAAVAVLTPWFMGLLRCGEMLPVAVVPDI